MILSLFLYVGMAQYLAYAQILARPRFIHPFYTDRKTQACIRDRISTVGECGCGVTNSSFRGEENQ
jgi:hypothetical protein